MVEQEALHSATTRNQSLRHQEMVAMAAMVGATFDMKKGPFGPSLFRGDYVITSSAHQ